MIRQVSESLDQTDDAEAAPAPSMRETHRLGRTHDELGMARCPICRTVLVARLGRAGPYFFCGCMRKHAA